MLPSGTTQDGTYDPKGASCTVLNQKVCNITEPGTNLVRSGTLEYCSQKIEAAKPSRGDRR